MKHLCPILWTKDLEETIVFYSSVLGFTAQRNFPGFVALSKEDVELMFIVPNNEEEEGDPGGHSFFPKPMLTGSIYIFMDKVDELWNNIKDKAPVKTAIADRQYLMRDFSILDNNGYELVFGEDISKK